MIHRVNCAAITNGCLSSIEYNSPNKNLDEKLLLSKGWKLDHGKWVCGLVHKKREKEETHG